MADEEGPVFRAAVVTAGSVENVILIRDDGFVLEGSNIVLLTEGSEVGIGWLWDGEEFHSPPDEE